MTQNPEPTHRAYSVIRGGEQGDCLIDIGHATPKRIGFGLDVTLVAMPCDGEVVCRLVSADDPAPYPEQKVHLKFTDRRRSAKRKRRRG